MPEAADGLIGVFKARNGEERSSTGEVAGEVATVVGGAGATAGTGMATGLLVEPLSMANC